MNERSIVDKTNYFSRRNKIDNLFDLHLFFYPLHRFSTKMILTHLEPSQPPSTTLSSVLSPRSNSLAIYPTTTPSITNTKNVQQQTNLKSTIYFAQYDYDQIESRDFLIETYTLFDSLQVDIALLTFPLLQTE